MLSPTTQISVQSLLRKTTTCLKRPVTTFFVSQIKKDCLKQPLKTLSSEEMRNKHKKQCMKSKRLSDYIYSIAILQCKVCLISTKAGHFIKSYKIM